MEDITMYDSTKGFSEEFIKQERENRTSIGKLEEHILNYYESKGFIVGVGNWSFEVHIFSIYKEKFIRVFFNSKTVIEAREEKIEDAFNKMYEYFKIES